MAEDKIYERSLEDTPTWAFAVVCFVLLAISIIIEHVIDAIGKWFKKKHKSALYESLEKVKGELMMLGFISMLLVVFQGPLSKICISQNVASTWHPCSNPKKALSKSDGKSDSDTNGRKLLEYLDPIPRRGKVAFVSAYGIHQLHIFIFMLAVFHILQCIITIALGRTKMRRWKKWENETKTIEYQFYNDPERFRLAKDTTFGQRHLNTWSQSSISLWIVSFFRQFSGSVKKVDYFALRHGFITAHLAPGSDARFDFQKYIKRSLDEDFKVVVGISPIIWFFAVLFLLANTHVGAKLQMIITKMGLRIQDRGEVLKGAPVVEPGDDLFWFNRPRLLLSIIHLVFFQNAFQLAHFAWSTYEFSINSCFHKTTVDTIIRLTMGVVIQVLCSYVTLPLYALVAQMGSTMKPTIFNDRVAAALKKWHHTSKKHVKDRKHSEGNNVTPFSSRSSTPTFGMSPIHLLHRHLAGRSDSAQTSPRTSNYENEQCDVDGSPSTSYHPETDETPMQVLGPHSTTEQDMAENTQVYERTLEETPTWAVAVVCFVLLSVSIVIEHIIHGIGKWFKKKHKNALFEALEKVKGELMLLGFLSLLLTVLQDPISKICVSKNVASTWHPCANPKAPKTSQSEDESEDFQINSRKLLQYYDIIPRRGKVAFVSAYGIHQLHIFIFVLAIFHILQCIVTLALGRTKMRKWRAWENETKTIEYQFYNDPERFRFARDTTFGRRHLNSWSQSTISLSIVSFFRQFFGSVNKVDYLTLRHGFITAHLAPGSHARFDFQKYIERSLEEDFKVVVGISPIIWFFAVLFLLTNTHGWYSYYWLPFIPLVIILLVGAKLQMIITKMGLRITDRGEVVKGAPVVEPGDDLFWFNRPRLLLFLIHLVLFQNAFQLAFFSWSTYEFSVKSCFHETTEDNVIRLVTGVVIQVLCSYVTLPLYALVTQMGSTMRPTIFNQRVASALKNWHNTAKKHVKNSKHTTPFSSRPSTPQYGMSPTHLLHKHLAGRSESAQTSPRTSNYENEQWGVEGSPSPSHHAVAADETQMQVLEPGSGCSGSAPELPISSQLDIRVSSSEFSFEKRHIPGSD
ncbi:MLO-like protein 12 [Glycine max]|nr:MLO-like protein 12 [Glycine max]